MSASPVDKKKKKQEPKAVVNGLHNLKDALEAVKKGEKK